MKKRSWDETDDFQLPKNNPTPEFGIIQIRSRIFIFFKIKCELCLPCRYYEPVIESEKNQSQALDFRLKVSQPLLLIMELQREIV